MTVLELAGFGLLIVMALMTLLWLVSLAIKNSSIVDIFWGTGFVVLGWLYFFNTGGDELRRLLQAALVTIWGLRLSGYIGWRNIGKGEDYRYQKWRKEAGEWWWWKSYFRVFVLQGVIMWIVAMPLLAAQYYGGPGELIFLDVIALMLWGIGFAFESGGDLQLARFKANPENKGKVMAEGFWRYTRHPNYFGDAVQWWAFYLLALTAGGWWSIFSPMIMQFLLMRVSGVALLEKDLKDKKPEYREYIEKTPAFYPWFPKQSA
ncbi:MAG: DUF1295 domain-containing protein [Chloroflexi bacterium]|nr:DUF1295 domain-containing protein [Chloroflexota bacterium]